ncbi:aldehyde dehydrogenase family protein [Sphingomonas sp. dw_22]|uniref:coniferyl aldehyde dehydrogenase n=1 Tax=Sphingomonas sp. dw_22 TaxID=2721175 RepID=UPI001BD358E8
MTVSDLDQFRSELNSIVAAQRAAYEADGFPGAQIRVDRIRRVVSLLAQNKDRLVTAISDDFGNRAREETLVDILAAASALKFAAENVPTWMQPKARHSITPGGEARVEYTPLGVVGVIGPWNYPITLLLSPLAGILAAGNRAILKPSEFTPRFSDLLSALISESFSPDEVSTVLGGEGRGAIFSEAPFDHLIFTGSTAVAKHVMRAAASNLTPVTLELGGKSPVIVTRQFDLAEAARRIMTVKARNAGQICLSPDYVFVPAGTERAFADACVEDCGKMFPEGVDSPRYSSIISDRHFQRLTALVDDARAKGAEIVQALAPSASGNGRRFPPTLLLNVTLEMAVMQEEIFGPLLPILPYDDLEDVTRQIRSGPRPLALYYFGEDDETARKVLDGTASGGVTINDVMAHVFCEDLPFSGIGDSGMGAYHGIEGFRTFSHARAIYRQAPGAAGVAAVDLLRPPFGPEFEDFISKAIQP